MTIPESLARLGELAWRPLLMAVLVSCATLEPIPSDTCGNGVVEADREDCDSFPADSCGKPDAGLRACRFLCDRKIPSCPAGWGCGADGICRQPTGALDSAGPPLGAGAASLVVGDFDGDGRADILGAASYGSGASARVHFFDAKAGLEATVPLQVAARLPMIKDFDRDGVDDIGFSVDNLTGGAFGVLTGRRDRSFATLIYPSATFPKTDAAPVTLTALPNRTTLPQDLGSTVLALTRSERGDRLVSLGVDLFLGEPPLEAPVPVGPSDLSVSPRAAVVFNPSTVSPCGDVVVAYNKDSRGHVLVLSPCVQAADGVHWTNTRKPITLETPGPLTNDVMTIADVNGDGRDEIFVETATGRYLTGSADGVTLTPWVPLTDFGELPLALADLNGDGTTDAVFSGGVLLVSKGDAGADASVPDRVVRPRTGQSWAEARVGNFNGDALPDILLRYPDSLDVELLSNAGDGRFTSFVVRSDQPVRAMTAGDFDGDRLEDVAFLTSKRPLDEGGEAELVIAYGKANGGPESSRVVGRFKNARALSALRSSGSGIDDLGVIEVAQQKDGLPTTTVTVLFGGGARQAIAPLFLQDDRANPPYESRLPGARGRFRAWIPFTLGAGALTAPSAIDVFSISVGVTVDLESDAPFLRPYITGGWLAPEDTATQGGLAPFREVTRLTGQLSAVTDDVVPTASIATTVGDIDSPPDGIDEVITLGRTALVETSLFVVRVKDATSVTTARVVTLKDTKVEAGDPISLVDLNADGAPDVVAISRVSGTRGLIAFLNDKNGGFAVTPITMSLPAEDPPIAFTRLSTGGSRPEIVVATERRLFRATLTEDSSFDVHEITSLLGTTSPRLTSVASGDFNGDGIEDVAVADSGAVRVLRQPPRLE